MKIRSTQVVYARGKFYVGICTQKRPTNNKRVEEFANKPYVGWGVSFVILPVVLKRWAKEK